MPSPVFICKHFNELSTRELQAIHGLRQQVFVVEQHCPYLDADTTDLVSWHLFAQGPDGEALAVCRIIPAGYKYREAAIGRVAIASTARGRGWGRALMQQALMQLARQQVGPIRISAQQYLQRFYEDLGFHVASSPYLEDDIAHIEMLRS